MPQERRGEWLRLTEASRVVGVDPDTLRRWADRGEITAFTTPGGHRRFARRSLERITAARAEHAGRARQARRDARTALGGVSAQLRPRAGRRPSTRAVPSSRRIASRSVRTAGGSSRSCWHTSMPPRTRRGRPPRTEAGATHRRPRDAPRRRRASSLTEPSRCSSPRGGRSWPSSARSARRRRLDRRRSSASLYEAPRQPARPAAASASSPPIGAGSAER